MEKPSKFKKIKKVPVGTGTFSNLRADNSIGRGSLRPYTLFISAHYNRGLAFFQNQVDDSEEMNYFELRFLKIFI